MRVILTGLARCYRRDTPILVATLSTRDTPIHAGHTRIAAQSCRNFGLADLAAAAGVLTPSSARVRSLQKIADARIGDYSHTALQANQVLDPDAMLALRVNGADLSPDHGYPARIIVPALPGVHNTKWVSSIDFQVG